MPSAKRDVRLLTTLASSLSVAFENARLFAETKRLLEETSQRNAELAVINNIQQGLVAEVELAGHHRPGGRPTARGAAHRRASASGCTTARPTWCTTSISTSMASACTRRPPAPAGLSGHVIETRQPLIINTDVAGRFAEIGAGLLPGTDMPLSVAAAPLPGRRGHPRADRGRELRARGRLQRGRHPAADHGRPPA